MATAEATREFSAPTKELGDKIVALTLKQAKELSDYLEEVHGIKAAAGGAVMMAAGPAGGGAAPVAEAKTEFDVVLEGFDAAKKIGVIKVIRLTDEPGLEGSQGSGRRRSQQGEGRHFEGRRRKGQKRVGRSRRQSVGQVTEIFRGSTTRLMPSHRLEVSPLGLCWRGTR